MHSVQVSPPTSPHLTINDFIDPGTYGFSSIAPFRAGHARVSRLDDVWFRQETIEQLIAQTDPSNATGRRDGAILLALEAPQGGKDRVACIFQGRIVGYLAHTDLDYLKPTLNALVAHRRHLEIPATLSIQNGTVAVFIHVPDTNNILPSNSFPAEKWLLLPGGSSVELQLKAGTLKGINPPDSGQEVPVAVTVRSVVEIRARSAMETFEVFLGAKSCGLVPPIKAASSLALIKVLESKGVQPLMRAAAYQSPKGTHLRIDCSSFESLDPYLVESILGI